MIEVTIKIELIEHEKSKASTSISGMKTGSDLIVLMYQLQYLYDSMQSKLKIYLMKTGICLIICTE